MNWASERQPAVESASKAALRVADGMDALGMRMGDELVKAPELDGLSLKFNANLAQLGKTFLFDPFEKIAIYHQLSCNCRSLFADL